jgi:Ribbon-helix-helix protein, copG family
MDEKEQKVITFKLSAEETEALDTKANQAGLSRSDYLRTLLAAHPQPIAEQFEDLLKYAIYGINQVYLAVYSIAEAEGKAGRFLTSTQLDEIHKQIKEDTVKYAVNFPKMLPVALAAIAERAKKEAE